MVLKIDDEDAHLLDSFGWYACRQGRIWYAFANARTPGKTRIIRLHRLVLPTPEGFVVDHINCDGLDNRRANLRMATRSQNAANASAHCDRKTSRYKGVSKDNRKLKRPWRAIISKHGVVYYSPRYATEDEAATAYDRMAIELFGEFARTNFKESVSSCHNNATVTPKTGASPEAATPRWHSSTAPDKRSRRASSLRPQKHRPGRCG